MQTNSHHQPEGRSVAEMMRKGMSEAEAMLIRAWPALPNLHRRPGR